MTPNTARTLGRSARRSLLPAKRQVLNQQIQAQLAALPGQIGTYFALPEEADPGRKAGWFLPCIEGAGLVFRQYESDQDCQPGELDIPVPQHGEYAQVEDLDWVLVPLTAFDLAGSRVGMGGGFYDQTLGRLPRNRRIGVAFDQQRVSRIQVSWWDQPLGAIVTPSGWITLR